MNLLFHDMCLILFVPAHAFRGFDNNYSASFNSLLHIHLSFLSLSLCPGLFDQYDPSCRGISFCTIYFALDTRQIIIIVVDSFGRNQVFLLDVCGWIADTIALCPSFVSLGAGEGTGKDGISRAAVLVYIPIKVSVIIAYQE